MKPYPPELEPFEGWHPFRAFQYFFEGGPLLLGLHAVVTLAVSLFLWQTIRRSRRTEPFVSWTLLLAVVPFVFFSWRCYSLARFVPLAIEYNKSISHIDIRALSYQAAYCFQLGVMSSALLLCIHSFVHAFCRKVRNA